MSRIISESLKSFFNQSIDSIYKWITNAFSWYLVTFNQQSGTCEKFDVACPTFRRKKFFPDDLTEDTTCSPYTTDPSPKLKCII